MNVTAIRIALGASVLVASAGAALSDEATASGKCPFTQAQSVSLLLYHASTTTRHTNVSRVRYTAAHAMPSARTYTTLAMAICSPANKSESTALD